MLIGSAAYSMDRKGRLVVPGWMREELGDPLAVVAGPESSALFLSWDRWQAALAAHAEETAFRRSVLPYAFTEPVEATTGRVMLRRSLRHRNGWEPFDDLGILGCGEAALIVDEDRFLRGEAPPLPGWLTGDPEAAGEVLLPRGDVLALLDLLGELRGVVPGEFRGRVREQWSALAERAG